MRTGRRAHQDGQASPEGEFDPIAIGQNGHRTVFGRVGREPGSVRVRARQGDVEISGLDRSRVETDPGHGELVLINRPHTGLAGGSGLRSDLVEAPGGREGTHESRGRHGDRG